MNTQTFTLLTVLLLHSASLRAHDFTRPDGSTFTGEIMGGTIDKSGYLLIIKAVNGRELKVPLTALAQPDQDHFYQWAAKHQKFALAISGLDERQGSQDKSAKLRNGRGQDLDGHTQEWVYKIAVTNRSAFPTPAMSADVGVWMDPTGKNSAAQAQSATLQVPPLKPGGSYLLESPAVALATFRAPPGMAFTNGNNRVHKQHLAGFTIKLQVQGTAVWVHEHRAGLLGLSLQSGNSILTYSPSKSGTPYSGHPDGLAQKLANQTNGKVRFSTSTVP